MSDGNTTWTTKPPDRAGWWWWRETPDGVKFPIEFTDRHTVILSSSEYGLGWFTKAWPACQWSDRPILPPQEPTT